MTLAQMSLNTYACLELSEVVALNTLLRVNKEPSMVLWFPEVPANLNGEWLS